jgi:CRP-like cAMP-binding protein
MAVDRSQIIQLLARSHVFRGIDNAKIEFAADRMTSTDYPAGEKIFSEGDEPQYFYYIYNGRVKVSHYVKELGGMKQIGVLGECDYFGQEVLGDNLPRQVTIETLDETTVLRISIPDFRLLLDEAPALGQRLQFIFDSFRLMLQLDLPFLQEDEFIYYVARKHYLFIIAKVLPPLLFGLVTIPLFFYLGAASTLGTIPLMLVLGAFFVTVAWGIWNFVDVMNDYHLVTNRRVIFKERIVMFYHSRHESPLEMIQSSTTGTSQLGRILNYGNVAIRTFTGTILFRSVAMPGQINALLQEHQLRAQSGQRRRERQKIEGIIEQSLAGAPIERRSDTRVAATQKAPEIIRRQHLVDMLHLRYEVNGTIIYRTHWLYLLKRILLPTLFIIVLFTTMILRMMDLFTLLSHFATFVIVFVFGIINFLWWLYEFLDWRDDVYILSNDQVVDVTKRPLGHETRDAAPIKNILNVEFRRLGIIGLIFNFGTVYIRVGDRQLTFDEVYNPSKVQREIFDRMAARNHAEKVAAQEEERQRLAEWISAYHRVSQRNQNNTPPRGGF